MIEGTVTGDELVVARLERLGPTVRQALHDAMVAQALRVQKAVVTEKLSGNPLHRRTARLASSITQNVTDEGDGVVARIGTNVRYGRVHELGGTFQIPAHERRTKSGKTATVRALTATFPQRSFLRSVLAELRPSIVEQIQASIARAVKED